MELTEGETGELFDKHFVVDIDAGHARFTHHLPCDETVDLGEPPNVQIARRHLAECTNSSGPVHTWRGQPWPKGTDDQEVTKRRWLQRIEEHPGTTGADYVAAVTILVEPLTPVSEDSGTRLQRAGFVARNVDGTCTAIFAW